MISHDDRDRRPELVKRVATVNRRLFSTYLSRDASAHYSVPLAFGVVAILGGPFIVGGLAGNVADGSTVALAAWLTAVAVPRPDPGDRLRQYAFRCVLLTGANVVGIATGGHLWAVMLFSTPFALAIPVKLVAATPLISLIIGIPAGGGTDWGAVRLHVAMFAAGCVWTCAIMFVPAIGGPWTRRSTPPSQQSLRATWSGWISAVRTGTPTVRYAFRVWLCFEFAYTALTLFHVPRPTWVIVGILTTLRPAWSDTYVRIVKRIGGTAAGCVLAAVLLVAARHIPESATVFMIIVCGAIARPMRAYNYGYWPIFASPVLLLLIDLGTPLALSDVGLRLVNNVVGAAIAAIATFVVWPSRQHAGATITNLHADHNDPLRKEQPWR